jgi:hypothetical protein
MFFECFFFQNGDGLSISEIAWLPTPAIFLTPGTHWGQIDRAASAWDGACNYTCNEHMFGQMRTRVLQIEAKFTVPILGQNLALLLFRRMNVKFKSVFTVK